jgi:hypothetical protein
MRRHRDALNPPDAAALSLKFEAYCLPHNKKTGETMITLARSNPRYPVCERMQRMQDFLMLSSFALWAAVLGLSPVLAFHLLMRA